MVVQLENDFVAIITAGTERPDLDYKEKINLEGTKKEKAEIAKDIIAIANSGGGFIVGGVKESSSGFQRIGMTSEELRSFDSTKLNQFVNNYCDPPINSITRTIEMDGKIFGVIIVPEFGEQPHIIVKSFEGVFNEADIFVRTGNNESRRAGSHEVRSLIEKSVTRRQSVLQHIIQSALPPTRPQIIESTSRSEITVPIDTKKYLEKYKGFRVVRITPVTNQLHIGLRNLKGAVEKAYIWNSEREVSFPHANPRYASITSETRLPVGMAYKTEMEDFHHLFFSYFDIHGAVYSIESLWEDTANNWYGEGSLGVISCIRSIFEALLFTRLYFDGLKWEGKVEIQFSVESSIPRRLIHDTRNSMPLFRNYQNTMSVPVSVKGEFDTTSDLKEIEQLVSEMALEFLWFFYYDPDDGAFQSYINYIKKDGLFIPELLK